MTFYMNGKKFQLALDEIHQSMATELHEIKMRQDRLELEVSSLKKSLDDAVDQQSQTMIQISAMLEDIRKQCGLLDESARLLLMNSVMDSMPSDNN